MAQGRSSTEIGSLIFAVVSVVTLGLGALVFGGLTGYVSTQMHKSIDGQGLMPYMVNLIIILVLVLIYFTFSVLLLNGILKNMFLKEKTIGPKPIWKSDSPYNYVPWREKEPKQILAYIVFGVIVTILSSCAAISWILLGPSERNRNFLVGGVWLFIIFVYIFILVVICMAHRNIKAQYPTRINKEVFTLNKKDFKKYGADNFES